MKFKINMVKTLMVSSMVALTNVSYADNFKRFSVTAGWMHVMPQGKANAFNIDTVIKPNQKYNVGEISQAGFLNSITDDAIITDGPNNTQLAKPFLEMAFSQDSGGPGKSLASILGFLKDENDQFSDVNATASGNAYLYGIDHWNAAGTGLEAQNVDTLGLTLNYHINDNVSLQFIGGIPPEVDIKGKGEIVANLTGSAFPDPDNIIGAKDLFLASGLDLEAGIPITNLGNKKKASTARAWTPAFEVQYQFGKSGINKFRPFIGGGLMYAYFNEVKLNPEIHTDLVKAGHMIQNILDGKAGAALDGKVSSANPNVKVKATDTVAAIATLGATYDINESWFGIASLSYAKLKNKAIIDVYNQNTGQRLIHSSTRVDIDPLISYVGVGYRF